MTDRLRCDPNRMLWAPTGLEVQALGPDGKTVGRHDIAQLDRRSLLAYLRVGDGDNVRAENVVGFLLGWGHLHVPPEMQD